MSIPTKIKDFLDEEQVSYQLLQHTLAYTAMEVAGAQHVPGKDMAKSVIVNADGQTIMCVLPSTHIIDFEKLKMVVGAKDIRLVRESELSKLFPDCELGAEPPFGPIYGLKVFVDKVLANSDEIVFNAGTHTDTLRLKFKDFVRLTNPTIAEFGDHI